VREHFGSLLDYIRLLVLHGVTIPESPGVFYDILSFFIGLVCSLFPSWHVQTVEPHHLHVVPPEVAAAGENHPVENNPNNVPNNNDDVNNHNDNNDRPALPANRDNDNNNNDDVPAMNI
jgi:hypothetical protein